MYKTDHFGVKKIKKIIPKAEDYVYRLTVYII